ncbi:MAG: hypothetical protein NC548_35285 [Lachnospiraceae bacterium]|nr:hypothetical protein [Lachnospiraceae bacterium]
MANASSSLSFSSHSISPHVGDVGREKGRRGNLCDIGKNRFLVERSLVFMGYSLLLILGNGGMSDNEIYV